MKRTMFILAALMFLGIPQVWAYSITITNPSFEDNVLVKGGSQGSVTGWSGSNKGVWYPDPADSPEYIKPPMGGGNQVAYAWNGGWLVQWLPYAVEDNRIKENYKYVLSVYVGTWETAGAGYSIYLMYNDSGNHAQNLKVESGTVPYSEEMTTLVQIEYTVMSGDPAIGRNIGISLDSVGFNEVDFDLVTLTATPVPIPAGIWLLGSGLVGLMGLRRKFMSYLTKYSSEQDK